MPSPPVPRSSTETLIAALRILAAEIQSPDGVANAAIAEAADRLEELAACRQALVGLVGCDDPAELREMRQAIAIMASPDVATATIAGIDALLLSFPSVPSVP